MVTIGDKYQLETEAVYEPDVIFGFDRFQGYNVTWTDPEDGKTHKKFVSANASILHVTRIGTN